MGRTVLAATRSASYGGAMSKRLPAALVGLGALVAIVLPAGPSAASGSCRNLRVDSATRAALVKAHHRPRDGGLAKGSVYYGVCGSTHYAIGTFTKVGGDQPEKFSQLASRAWKDQGDGFENGCGTARRPIPLMLVRLWGFCTGG